jgi:hypothetical protein
VVTSVTQILEGLHGEEQFFFANAKDPQFKKKNIRDIECAILSGIQSCLQLLKDGPKYSSLK